MFAQYTYLISSLPALVFGGKPPLSFEKFIQACHGLIPEKNLAILKNVSINGEYPFLPGHPLLGEWYKFDTALRNELVKLRATRKKINPALYLRGDGYIPPAIARMAINAQKTPSLLDAEKMLDQQRWRFLDQLAYGHYFDFEKLIIYALKLLILTRWQGIDSAEKDQALAQILN